MHPASPPPDSTGFNALLKNRSFLALWIGQIFAQVADKVFYVLLIILLEAGDYRPWSSLEHSDNSMRSAIMVAFTVPAILFGSAAGIYVDRFSKKQMLLGCNLIRAFLIVALPFLPKAFIILLVITFLVSTVTQFFAPAEQAAIPLVVPKNGLMTANNLFASTIMGGVIIGMTIGEPLLSFAKDAAGDDRAQEFLLAGFYLVSAGLIYMMQSKEADVSPQAVFIHPLHDFKEGLRYLKHNRLVSNAMVQLTILYSVFAALQVLAISLSGKIGLKETQFGFILAAAGVGMVFGTGLLGHWSERLHHKPLPLIGFLTMGFVLGMFAFTRYLWLGLTLSAMFGVGASMINGPMQALIQEKTPESMRGKVFGFQNNAINIALSLPLAITGPLTDGVSKAVGSDDLGLRVVLLSLGLLVALMGAAAWRNTRDVLQDVV